MSNWSDTIWTPPVVERLKTLVKIRPWPGYAAVAETLTTEFSIPVTKNSVIGKARRDGIAPKLHPNPGGNRGEYNVGKPIVRPAPHKLPDKPVPPPKIDKVTIWQLEPQHCRWPYGDDPPYLYCGRPTLADCSWCARHARIAFPALRRTL